MQLNMFPIKFSKIIISDTWILIYLMNLLQQHWDDYTDVDIQVKSGAQIPDVYIQTKIL